MSDDLPSYKRPPLDEVAAGIQFKPINFRLVDVGAFHRLIASEYPNAVDAPPMGPTFETFSPVPLPFQMPFFQGPAWRSWFLSAEEDFVIQLQPDRLLTNWRTRPGVKPYPRYQEVRRRFVEAAEVLSGFLLSCNLPPVQPNQCELTYFNKIGVPENASFADLAVFLRGIQSGKETSAFSDIQFKASRTLSGGRGAPVARLTVEGIPLLDEAGQKRWGLNITVRGRPITDTLEGSLELLDRAHVEIVRCFDEITTENMHRSWGKVQ